MILAIGSDLIHFNLKLLIKNPLKFVKGKSWILIILLIDRFRVLIKLRQFKDSKDFISQLFSERMHKNEEQPET
jgi:hypothetical protein